MTRMPPKTAKTRPAAPATTATKKSRAKVKPASKAANTPQEEAGYYRLRLYVAGQTRKSLQAIANLKHICEENMPGRYSIEVVDLIEHPHLARGDQILAIPTLVRQLPQPIRKIIGDLSHTERVLVGLDVSPVPKRKTG